MDVFIASMVQVLRIFLPFPSHGRSLTTGNCPLLREGSDGVAILMARPSAYRDLGYSENGPLRQASNLTVRLDFLDPVSLLKVHQPISQTTKRLCIATVPFFSQILADQIEHGGEGTEVVVFLNMELQACFVHARSMARAS